MKCVLAAAGFVNEDIERNKNTVIRYLREYSGKADAVLFGEAFLQGFYSADFCVGHDSRIAREKDAQEIMEIRTAARNYSVAVSFGFIEKEKDIFYSSQITFGKDGEATDLYRRVSPGWKEKCAGEQYREGKDFHTFCFMGKKILAALCGDLWYDGNIRRVNELEPDLVWWPVYTDYHFSEWNTKIKYEYAKQIGKLHAPVLYVNSVCLDRQDEYGIAKGGAVLFEQGRILEEIPAGSEGTLIAEC